MSMQSIAIIIHKTSNVLCERLLTNLTGINIRHIADDNKHVISFNKKMGFVVNNGDVVFPDNLLVNGLKQTEYVRNMNQYNKAREKIQKLIEQSACYFI